MITRTTSFAGLRRLAPLLPVALTVLLSCFAPSGAAQSGGAVSFTYSPSNPTSGQEIQFTDTSTGFLFGWFWDFGDGGSSGTQSPTHTYATPGFYKVTFTTFDQNLRPTSASDTINVSAGGTTVADFSFDPVSPVVGQTVTFTDLSQGSPTAWSWSFGDGGTSTSRNPTHTYASAGSKNVTLTVSTGSTPSSVSKTVGVQAVSISASFAFFPDSPLVGQDVTFQDTSTGSPAAWSWTFGEGGTSTSQNPTHQFGAAGIFKVTLVASGSAGSSSASKTITVSATQSGTFSAKVASLKEVPSDTTNGNGQAEPGERAAIRITVSNGTSHTQPAVVGQLISRTPGINMLVDQVEFGTVASGASAAAPGIPFEFVSDASTQCGANLSFDLRLSYGGQPVVVLPLTTKLGTSPCAPPTAVSPSVVMNDGAPPGPSYRIGSALAVWFTGKGSQAITGYKIELSRDGGTSYPEVLSTGDPTLAGVGQHLWAWRVTGPEAAAAWLRVTASIAGANTVSVISSRAFSIVAAASGEGIARLPVAVQSAGASGTFFTTEATFASPDRAAAFDLVFTPIGKPPLALPRPVVIGRGTRFFPDMFQLFRDQGVLGAASGLVGTLTATVGGVPAPVIQARVVNIPGNGIGTFGLSFLSRLEGDAYGPEAWVSGLLTSSSFRSNLSIAHAGGGSEKALEVDVELYDGSIGNQTPGSPKHAVLQPNGFFQINNFQDFTVTPGQIYLYRIHRTAGDDQFRAYGTIIDAVTGDSSYVEASPPEGNDTAHVIRLASVVEAEGLFGSFFTSDVVVVNRSAATPATVSLHLDASGIGSFDVADAFVLLPRQARLIPNVIQFFREHGAALTGTVVGPLRVSLSGGDGYVGVRTFSARSNGDPSTGTFGLAFPGRRPAEEAQGSILLVGVRKSSSFRTNLSIAHAGTQGPLSFSYQLVSASGNAYPPLTTSLAPGGFFQANDVVQAAGALPGDYYVVVTRTSGSDPWEAYLTIIDNVTNDGSFVEMVPRLAPR